MSTTACPSPLGKITMRNRGNSGLTRRIGILLAGLFVALVWSLAAHAQTSPGLPGGPMLGDSFQRLEKTATDCDKCLDQERSYHAQVDVYEAARAAYDAQAGTVRRAADAFLDARKTHERLNGEFEALDAKVWDLLLGRSDGSSDYEYREATDARDRAEQPALDAGKALDRARGTLDTELRALERLRLRALQEMRRALRLQSAMYQCEFSCSVEELNLDEPESTVPTPATGTLDPSVIPVPENFIGVVAKCAKCQPLAEMVNTIRSHRRSYASTARSVYESLTHNRATLDRLEREARSLELEERALYRDLLSSFNARGPGEDADRLDRIFDAGDQRAAAQSLRRIAERRAGNARMRTGLAETIATQLQGVLEAIANYRIHTILLQSAEQRLSACEQTCKPADADRVGLKDPLIDPAYPVPENFGPITAKCPECQPLADALAQAKSERRRVAWEIQDVVWLLNSRRAGLERMQAQADALEREERGIAEQLIGAGDETDDAALVDRLFEIEAETTGLVSDMLWAEDEIRRMEPQLAALLKAHEELTWRVEDLQAELQVCEFNCPDTDDGAATAIPGAVFDPSLPQPELFLYVTTDCPTCQPLADALNALLLERYTVAVDIQSTAARIAAHEAALAQLDARMAALLAREQELVPISTGGGDKTARDAATRELHQIDGKRQRLDAEMAAAAEALREADTDLAANRAYYDQVNRDIAEARARLAECEKNCADTGGGATGLTGQDDFVTTDCAPCEALASLVNDAVGSLIGAERALEAAKTRRQGLDDEASQRKEDLAAALARERALNDEWLSGATDARKAEIDTELHEVDAIRNRLTDEQAREGAAQGTAQAEADAAQTRVDELTKQVADLKAQLAECEKQCAPPADDGAVALPDPAPFVTTDCAPCEALASLVNDAVGSLIGAERALEAAKTRRQGLDDEASQRKEDLAAALARERALNDEWLSGATDARKAEIDAELHEVDAIRNRLTDEQAREGAAQGTAQAEVDAAQTRVDELTKQVADLKAQLAECEKQCAPAGDDGAAALPDPAPFVTTDCAPCETLASLVNDAVGSLIGAERALEAAKTKRQGLNDEASQRKQDLAAALARERALNDEWLSGATDARKAEIDAELHEVDAIRNRLTDEQAREGAAQGTAQAEVDAAQTRVDELTKQVADLKAQLAECEKQCAPAGDDGALALPDPAPFVTTDCSPCAQIASLLNDVVGSIITTEKTLTEAQAALEALLADIASAQAAKTAAQDAFAAALVEKSRLEAADQDGSGQQTIADAQIKRASELLSDLDDFEIEELDLAERVEDVSTMLAQLRQQEVALRNDLAECEKQCGEPGPATATTATTGTTAIDEGEDTAVGFDPNFILDKLQPEGCRGGSDCTFEIGATNAGAATFRGPLFLRESASVAAGGNGAAFGDWHCSPAANGQSICLTDTEVASGQTVTLRVPIRLPGYVAPGTENCVDVIVTVDERLLVQLVQVGLAAQGFDPGVADGWPGPRTNAAVSAFGEQAGRAFDPDDMMSIYRALFGTQPPSGTAGAGQACVQMEVENPPRTTPAATTPPRTTTAPTPQTQPQPQPQQDEAKPGGFSIGIGIGIGGGEREREHEGRRGGDGPMIELPFPNIFGN